ncbi:MAG: NAD(P)H-dependent oxidoreductase [Clostridia bacterium]|nr:NAD(P)H-dependent oxidoreductase [Clostridia bacterium]
MDSVLYINACFKECSRTNELAEHLLSSIGDNIETVNLFEENLKPLDFETLRRRDELLKAGKTDDDFFATARQFAAADKIVIAAPYWDLLFPAVLRTYLENITVCGITFRYSDKGIPVGLCKAKQLYYVTTAGGFIGENNFGFEYVKALAVNLFGIETVNFYCAEGLDIYGADTALIMQKAKDNMFSADEKPSTIPYPEKYGDNPQKDGASAFGGITDHNRSKYYVANDFYNMKSEGSLHILSHFETYQQTTEYTCGAACALMVLNWFGKKKYHEIAVSQLVESHPSKGSTVENIADFFDLIGWDVDFHADTYARFKTIEEVEKFFVETIDSGNPIMIDWVDWAGHWQVLIGIDTCSSESPYDDVLIFADPYDVTDHNQDGYYTFPLGRFMGMWREGACAEKIKPYVQPYVIAKP